MNLWVAVLMSSIFMPQLFLIHSADQEMSLYFISIYTWVNFERSLTTNKTPHTPFEGPQSPQVVVWGYCAPFVWSSSWLSACVIFNRGSHEHFGYWWLQNYLNIVVLICLSRGNIVFSHIRWSVASVFSHPFSLSNIKGFLIALLLLRNERTLLKPVESKTKQHKYCLREYNAMKAISF